jgi:hypothetical protein
MPLKMAALGWRFADMDVRASVSCSNFMYCLHVPTSVGSSSWCCFSSTSMFDRTRACR